MKRLLDQYKSLIFTVIFTALGGAFYYTYAIGNKVEDIAEDVNDIEVNTTVDVGALEKAAITNAVDAQRCAASYTDEEIKTLRTDLTIKIDHVDDSKADKGIVEAELRNIRGEVKRSNDNFDRLNDSYDKLVDLLLERDK